MRANELKQLLKDGGLSKYSSLYADLDYETERMIAAIESFEKNYGEDRDIEIFSVPGRTEIIRMTAYTNG